MILIRFLFTFNCDCVDISISFDLFYLGKLFCFPFFIIFTIQSWSVIYDRFFPARFSGQITQWNLIFYGTDDPPQKTDPPRLGKKKTVNDLVHNSLENSQWGFITQDVSFSSSLACS